MYADNTCVFYQLEVAKKTKNFLNKEFLPLLRWFRDNKLSIRFRKDKTKSILFSKARGLSKINTSFEVHSIKQHKTIDCLGCQLHFKLSGEAMTSKFRKKINVKLKSRYRQSRYLTHAYRRLLSNGLIQPHFDYCCS